ARRPTCAARSDNHARYGRRSGVRLLPLGHDLGGPLLRARAVAARLVPRAGDVDGRVRPSPAIGDPGVQLPHADPAGDGDGPPNGGGVGRLCGAEAMVGQFYLAIMIARLVGLQTSLRAARAFAAGDMALAA